MYSTLNPKPSHRGFDLLIVDLLEGLFVPLISPSVILEWNKHDSDKIEAIFEFAFHFLHDDAHTRGGQCAKNLRI